MNYTIKKKLPLDVEFNHKFHLTHDDHKNILQHRQEIKDILDGDDDRLIMIVGPCSAWPKEAVLEYAEKLATLNEKVKHQLKIVMRAYIQKPRTTVGWLGPAIQPDPFSPPDIDQGIRYAQDMMLKVVKLGLPIASEVLFTHNFKCFTDLLSWACIGARSAEDQEHRIFASAIDYPVGLKNPTHGSLQIGVNSIFAAQHSHAAVFDGFEVQTHGNQYAHAVLRGANGAQNYSIPHLEEMKNYFDAYKIKNPAIFIDASHDNCVVNGKKDYRLQTKVIFDVIESIEEYPQLKNLIKGFMIESFLMEGNQALNQQKPNKVQMNGLSITDPCLGWEQTEKVLLELADKWLQKSILTKQLDIMPVQKQLYHFNHNNTRRIQ